MLPRFERAEPGLTVYVTGPNAANVSFTNLVREEYDRTGDNTLAVGRGLAATARVISAAAAIMVVVFGSFVLTPDVSVKQIGLGLAAAVLVDATVVRLLPARREDSVRAHEPAAYPAEVR